MRQVLEVLARANHPVGIVTKSALVLRDLDLLAPMAEKGLVKVALSVTTLDSALARKLEPRANGPERRLDIRRLAEANVPTSVMVAPVIPALSDAEIETILTRAKAAGARGVGYVLLRLPRSSLRRALAPNCGCSKIANEHKVLFEAFQPGQDYLDPQPCRALKRTA
jgi:DNA repair photolyase